jgi:hypothetical protein
MPRSTQAQVALIAGLLYLLVGLALVGVLISGMSGGGVEVTSPVLLGAVALGVLAFAGRLFQLARNPRVAPALPRSVDHAADDAADRAADNGEETIGEPGQPSGVGVVPRPRAESTVGPSRRRPRPNVRTGGRRG